MAPVGLFVRYASLFSGVEAATVAWEPLGWKPQIFAEFDEFPSEVLAHHYPTVPNVGDVTKHDWKQYAGQLDLVVGGSPCQSFSVAGQRLGLDDPRGNLALHYLGIVRDIRPEWFLFENVPGLLSSDEGRDFGTFLAEVERIGYSCAWRILDARYFGVAQRRRRLFVVGHASGDWRRPAAVLFERTSLSGDSAPSVPSRQDTAPPTTNGVGQSSELVSAKGVGARLRAFGDYACDETASTLKARDYKDGTDLVAFDHTFGQNYGIYEEVAPTLKANGAVPTSPAVAEPRVLSFFANQRDEVISLNEEVKGLMASAGSRMKPFVAQAGETIPFRKIRRPQSETDHETWGEADAVGTLTAHDMTASDVRTNTAMIESTMRVRRLTPIECERLQGFPDNYTLIEWKGKAREDCPDGHRFKAMGNSMAVPLMRWLGERIQAVEDLEFEGIGKKGVAEWL